LELPFAGAPEKVAVLALVQVAAQGQVDHSCYQCSEGFAAFELYQGSWDAGLLEAVCTPSLTLLWSVQLQEANLLLDLPLTRQHEGLHLCGEPNTGFALDCDPGTQEVML
jgi:hypothetical protein